MSRHIIKITDPEDKKDYYLEWSTITDSACSNGHSLEDFKTYYKNRYGEEKEQYLNAHLARIEQGGTNTTSSHFYTLEDLMNQAKTTIEKILNEHCRGTDDSDHA